MENRDLIKTAVTALAWLFAICLSFYELAGAVSAVAWSFSWGKLAEVGFWLVTCMVLGLMMYTPRQQRPPVSGHYYRVQNDDR